MLKFNHYKDYKFEQFIEDSAFRNWVTDPSKELDQFWSNFLTSHPEKAKTVQAAKEFLLGTKDYFDPKGMAEEKVMANLEHVLENHPDQSAFSRTARRSVGPRVRRNRRWAIAATIALVLAALGWFVFPTDTITYATTYGEWKTISLPDESVVQLNANSRLRIDKDWEKGADRIVHLEGEAFFKVTKQVATGAKFTVITPDLQVEVLGTSFNVHTRGSATEVYLEEGKVLLNHGDEETEMQPGDFIAYSAEQQKITARHRTQEEQVKPDAWKDGSIIFTNEYAFQILKKLEDIYGVKIQVNNDAIYSKKYTISVPLEELEETVIPILERSMQVQISQRGNTLIFE